MLWYWWVAVLIGYASIGAVVTYFWAFLDCSESKKKSGSEGEEVFVFIGWPIALPLVIGEAARRNREKKEQEATKAESSCCGQSETSEGAK